MRGFYPPILKGLYPNLSLQRLDSPMILRIRIGMHTVLTICMKIIEKSKLKDGSYIVLRDNGYEYVTGFIPAHQVKDKEPTDSMQHTWGHYFDGAYEGAETRARKDYIERIGRGY